jgi:hypothetical protein
MIIMITVIGTQRNIPGMPQTEPHNPRESKITIGLRLSRLPISLGSSRLPMQNCTAVSTEIVAMKGPNVGNCTSVSSEGNKVAMIEPMVGMKLSKKIKTAQKLAKSTPTTLSTK